MGNTWVSTYPTSKKYFLHVRSIEYFAPIYLGVHIYNLEKYFLHVQSIQYFAPKYMGVDIYPTMKKYFLHVQSIQYFAPEYLGIHIYNFEKNTSCTCKVFNTLHLNTWGSIYLTLKKYFLHIQGIQYFAPKYLGVHLSNFKKILLAHTKHSILCTYIPGGPYIQLRKIHLACAKYSILCTKIPGGPYIQ